MARSLGYDRVRTAQRALEAGPSAASDHTRAQGGAALGLGGGEEPPPAAAMAMPHPDASAPVDAVTRHRLDEPDDAA